MYLIIYSPNTLFFSLAMPQNIFSHALRRLKKCSIMIEMNNGIGSFLLLCHGES